jgi:membrane protease YdiL (CAAX protease family)
VLSITFGVAVLVTTVLTDDSTTSIARRIGIGSALTLLLYAVVSLLVGSNLDRNIIRPRLIEGSPQRAIGIGAAVGLGAAVVVGGFISLVSGGVTSDPSMIAVFSERDFIQIFVVIFIAVIAAPVIEEVLFRGLLVESFRSRGRTSAILAGAVAFSFWHLNPLALRYYVLMGFLLGFVYWRLGLAGSVSAHAVFNGTLVVLAAVTIAGGPSTVTKAGVSVDVPNSWHVVEEGVPSSVDVAIESPAGSAFVVEHIAGEQLVAQQLFSPQDALRRLPPGAKSPRNVSVSGGPAVRYSLELRDGTPSELIVVPRGRGLYVVTLVSGGSAQAGRHFDAMLATMRLPVL